MDLFCVFFVNKSHLLTFDPKVPNAPIQQIQQSIRELTGVRREDQVLLVSGGDTVDTEKRVGDYSGYGTQSNPVFLFQRTGRHERDEMSCSQEINELFHIIDECIEQARRVESLPDIKNIYIQMPDKARHCIEVSKRAVVMCARLVQEHQLLQQGWLALVNNMDDSINRLKKKAGRHEIQRDKVRSQQETANKLLMNLDDCLEQLKMIKLPTPLLAHSKGVRDPSTLNEITLYEWISKTDPHNSLEDLVEEVKKHLKTFGETDTRSVAHTLDVVIEQSKNSDFREIKGINKRLTQLESKLIQMEQHERTITAHVQVITTTPPHLDSSLLQERISEHRREMSCIYQILNNMREMSRLFHQSKTELLSNVRTRLNGWIVQAYERLHNCHRDIMVFEEKFNGLRQRLDLVKQIKEAPVMFATAVCEVIRRQSFQTEFTSWHRLHSEKCSIFNKEESTSRTEFAEKLKSHFLRILFQEMFDELPQFYVKSISPIDEHLPPLNADYLRQVRKDVSSLEGYLKISSPQVFSRLTVRDPSLPAVPSAPHMRREESFFSPDAINNIASLNRNFPSTNWLGDDVSDGSPSVMTTLRMGESPSTRALAISQAAIPIVPSLNQLSMLGDDSSRSKDSCLAKSAPINIPHQLARDVSEKSSQFSTPEDHFSPKMQDSGSLQQFPVDDLTSRSQNFDHLKPILDEINALAKGLLDVRAELLNDKDGCFESFGELATKATAIAERKINELEEKHRGEIDERNTIILNLTSQLDETSLKLKETQQNIERVRCDSENLQKENEEEIQKLKADKDQFDQAIKDARSEAFKELTIEYEIATDRTREGYEAQLEEKDRELRSLRRELEKKSEEVELLHADPHGEFFRKQVTAEIRSELEKEFKSKSDLITKGMNQQKEDAINRNKKEMEYELKLRAQKMDVSVRLLSYENEVLNYKLEENCEEGARICRQIADDVKQRQQDLEKEIVGRHYRVVSTQTDPSAEDLQSDFLGAAALQTSMAASQYDMKESTYKLTMQPEPEHQDVSVFNSNEIQCQTRISLRSMELMVAIHDIHEGMTVLVIWDERHSAYILFSASPTMHFVKDSSIRRLSLCTPDSPRRNWILAKVVNMDLCQIKKENNRYRLPVDTRVYRVDVTSLPMELRITAPTVSPATTSKA